MKKAFTFFSLLTIGSSLLLAQLAYTPENSYSVQGEYVDLGSNGTIISTANNDDANSSPQAIGFGFNYNGTTNSHFILNTNGFIKLGTIGTMGNPSSPSLAYTYFNQNNFGGVFNSTSGADNNTICVMNHDLEGPAAEYRYQTTGAVGNRVCTIQWKNVVDKNILDSNNSPKPHVQYNSMSFQIKLYESNRMIEFIYGNFNPTGDSSLSKFAVVGLRGNNSTQLLRANKLGGRDYSLVQFVSGNYPSATAVERFNAGFQIGNNNNSIGKSIPANFIRPLPEQGRTLRFLRKIANDVEVRQIYAYHGTVIPWGLPNTISARVSNVGTGTASGIWVHVEVKGANAYSDSTFYASIGTAAPITVNFTGYEPINLGMDSVKVWLTGDAESSNNSTSWIQRVSNEEIGYSDSSSTMSNFGFGATGSGIFAAKYSIDGKRRVSKVHIRVGYNTTSINETIYAVVVDASNTIIGRSPNFVIGPNDLEKWHTFDIYGGDNTSFNSPPPLVSNADFYVGLAQPAGGYNPMSLQNEPLCRANSYYYHGGITSGGVYIDLSTQVNGLENFRIAVNARLDGTSLKLEPITGLDNPSCAEPSKTIEVTVTNQDTFAVDFAVDTMHLGVVSTGVNPQSYSTVITSGTLDADSSATFVITNNFDFSMAGKYTLNFEARQWMEVDTVNNYRTFVVNVVDTPGVTLEVSPDSIVCANVPVTFMANPFTAGSTSYQWKINGVNQGSQTSVNTLTPSLSWGDVVSVDLITDHCTTGTFTIPSNEIKMKINPKPRLINGLERDTVIEFTKKSYAIGTTAGHSYLWRVSGGTITGDSTGAAVQIEWGSANPNSTVSISETDLTNCTFESVLPVNVISIVGIDSQFGLTMGEAYPNPAHTELNIPVFSSKDNTIELKMVDVTGKTVKEVFSGNFNGNKVFSFSVDDLNQGLYFYKLTSSNGYQKIGRLAIKH